MKRSETARRQIVDYVRQEICLHGVSKLTMDDIARGMRVSKRTLYQLFPQKTCLIRLCLSDIANEARGKLPGRGDRSVAACTKMLWRRQVFEALTQCRDCDCLLAFVDPERVAGSLFDTLFEQCRQGASRTEQRLMSYVLLRGFFKLDKIGYIDQLLDADKLPV